MADTKISGLNSLTGSDVTTSTDVLPIVDTSATETKKILVDELGIALGRTVRKTANESVSSSSTLQDDDHLTFPIAANEEWVAVYKLSLGSALGATGFKVAVTVPSGASMEAGCKIACLLGSVAGGRTSTSGATIINNTFAAAEAGGDADVHVWVSNGATPGSVTLQWAQSNVTSSALTLFKGSFLVKHRIA